MSPRCAPEIFRELTLNLNRCMSLTVIASIHTMATKVFILDRFCIYKQLTNSIVKAFTCRLSRVKDEPRIYRRFIYKPTYYSVSVIILENDLFV